MGTAAFVAAALILAVPGGCIGEPEVLGTLELHNRTEGRISIQFERTGRTEIVEACTSITYPGAPLNGVVISREPAGGFGLSWGTSEPTAYVAVVVSSDDPQIVMEPPADLPPCEGTMP